MGIIVGVALSAGMVRDGFEKDAELSLKVLPDVTVQKLVAGRADRIGRDMVREVEKIDHVKKVVPRIWGYVPIKIKEDVASFTLMGIDVKEMPLSETVGESLQEGRFLEPGDRGKIVIGKGVGECLGATVGQRIKLKDSFGNEDEFEVIGVFESAVQVYTADMILTTLEDASEFFVMEEGDASDLCVYLDDPCHANIVAERLTGLFQGAKAFTRDAIMDLTKQAYAGRSGTFQLLWMMLLGACLLVAWCQATNLSWGARREIGILKAVGWGIGDVIESKLLGALWLGCFACLLGVGLASGYLWLGAPGIKGYFLGWSRLYPDFPLPLALKLKTFIVVWVAGTVPLLIATVIPAWLAGIVEPDEAIRD